MRVCVQSLDRVVHGRQNLLFLALGQFASKLLIVVDLILERIRVALQLILGVDSILENFVLCESLGVRVGSYDQYPQGSVDFDRL